MTTVFMIDEKNYRNAPAALGQIAVRAATLGLCSRRRGKQEGRRVANVIIRVQSIEAHAGHMAPSNVGEWLSLVEHLVRDQGVGGSNPLSPTNLSNNLHRPHPPQDLVLCRSLCRNRQICCPN